MSALFKTLGVTGLLLTALLAAGARADDVTIRRCKRYHRSDRVRLYPTDSNATRLWLDGCHYSNVTLSDLDGLTSVVFLSLSGNDIVTINPSIFRSAPRLNEVLLSYNKIRELPVLAGHACRLTVLYLSHNLIKAISARTFSACTKLQRLYLQANNINYVHPDAFRSLHDLIELDLHRNEIKFVSDQMFVNNRHLVALGLHENKITYLPLDFAAKLKGVGVNLVYLYIFSNPWRCACLLEAVADIKRAGVRYYNKYPETNITYYDGTRVECVYTGPCIPTLLRSPPCPLRGT